MSAAGRNKEQISVGVVYYLTTNGQLQHPHFMDVPLSSPNAPFLSDVMNRLNVLRGKGIASIYSWSCKRSYKNGYVWHDLSEKDFIYPAHGHEYVLKGSELPKNPIPPDTETGGGDDSIENDNSNMAEVSTQTDNKEGGPEVVLRGGEDQQIQKWQRRRSSVLMQLISCGSLSLMGLRMSGKRKAYFSGTVGETKKEEFPALKRSTSYNGGHRRHIWKLKRKGLMRVLKQNANQQKLT